MAYGIPRSKQLIRELGGTVARVGSYRATPRSGRCYTVQLYRVEVPGVGFVILDQLALSMLSFNATPEQVHLSLMSTAGVAQ